MKIVIAAASKMSDSDAEIEAFNQAERSIEAAFKKLAITAKKSGLTTGLISSFADIAAALASKKLIKKNAAQPKKRVWSVQALTNLASLVEKTKPTGKKIVPEKKMQSVFNPGWDYLLNHLVYVGRVDINDRAEFMESVALGAEVLAQVASTGAVKAAEIFAQSSNVLVTAHPKVERWVRNESWAGSLKEGKQK